MEFSFRQRSQDLQLSKTKWCTDQVSTERPRPTNSYGGHSDRCRNSFAATTSSQDPYPTYRDDTPCGGWRDVHNCAVRITIQLPSGLQRNLANLLQVSRVSNPDSEALPPGGSLSGRKSSRVTLGLQLMMIPNVLFPLTSRLTYPRYARIPSVFPENCWTEFSVGTRGRASKFQTLPLEWSVLPVKRIKSRN